MTELNELSCIHAMEKDAAVRKKGRLPIHEYGNNSRMYGSAQKAKYRAEQSIQYNTLWEEREEVRMDVYGCLYWHQETLDEYSRNQ